MCVFVSLVGGVQNAMKLKPDLLDRYRIYILAQKTKRLKETMDGTMDLQSYVEFKRNYRMLARAHKEALQCQRDFWKLFMHHKAQDSVIKQAMKELEASSTRAQVGSRYSRVVTYAHRAQGLSLMHTMLLLGYPAHAFRCYGYHFGYCSGCLRTELAGSPCTCSPAFWTLSERQGVGCTHSSHPFYVSTLEFTRISCPSRAACAAQLFCLARRFRLEHMPSLHCLCDLAQLAFAAIRHCKAMCCFL